MGRGRGGHIKQCKSNLILQVCCVAPLSQIARGEGDDSISNKTVKKNFFKYRECLMYVFPFVAGFVKEFIPH